MLVIETLERILEIPTLAKMWLGILTVFLHAGLVCTGAALANVSSEQWAALNSTVNGQLKASVPFARPCFSEVVTGVLGVHDQKACNAVIEAYTDPGECDLQIPHRTTLLTSFTAVRSGVFGSYMNVGALFIDV